MLSPPPVAPEPDAWAALRARAHALGARLTAGPPAHADAAATDAAAAAWLNEAAHAVAAWLGDVAGADGGRDHALVVAIADLRAAVAARSQPPRSGVPPPPPSPVRRRRRHL